MLRLSYLHNGISYTGKMTSLYLIRAQVVIWNVMIETHLKGNNNQMKAAYKYIYPGVVSRQSILIHWAKHEEVSKSSTR